MNKFPNTLSFKLTFLYASSFAVILLATLAVLYFTLNSYLNKNIDEDLIEDIHEFREMMSSKGMPAVLSEIKQEELSEDPEEFFIQLLDQQGNIKYASDLSAWKGLSVNKVAVARANENEDILISTKLDSRDTPDRIAYGKIGENTIIQFAESTNEKAEIMEIIFIIFIFLLLIVIPMASLAGWLITKHSLSGLNKVSSAAYDIERGLFHTKVNLTNQNEEIQSLTDTFNSMAGRIRNLIKEMREMIDNIAHDLRSPIGRIRAISEDSLSSTKSSEQYRNAASDTLEECDRLIHLINTTLDVAEAEAQVAQANEEEINLSSLITDSCEIFEPAAEHKEIQLSQNIDDGCTITGLRTNLQRMIANLIDNALKYTPDNGKVNIRLEKDSKHYNINISDNGMGIPEAEQDRIFDRFYRCDESRSKEGCGLGLTFARAVARAHGGDIQLYSKYKNGSEFIVTLPY